MAGTTPTITVNALGGTKSVMSNAVIAGTSGLTKAGPGTLILTGRNPHSGTTTVKSGVLAVANQAALGEGLLNLGSGTKVELNFIGQSYVTQLTIGGAVQAEGTYGSSKSSATTKSDTVFSGTGVITVRASIDSGQNSRPPESRALKNRSSTPCFPIASLVSVAPISIWPWKPGISAATSAPAGGSKTPSKPPCWG
jgi:autotransporter-associated beta strand protein